MSRWIVPVSASVLSLVALFGLAYLLRWWLVIGIALGLVVVSMSINIREWLDGRAAANGGGE